MESMKKEQLIRELSNYGYDMVSPGAGNPQQVLVERAERQPPIIPHFLAHETLLGRGY